MYRLNGKQRRRRREFVFEQLWADNHGAAEDPGLRTYYDELPRAPIRLIVCPLSKDVNQGGLLRLAEAMRIERIDFAPEYDGAYDLSADRGTRSRQPWRWMDVEPAIQEARSEGYTVVALTMSERAIPYQRAEWTFPLALVLGSELMGVSAEVEAMCDATVAIPHYGIVQSLNVAVATGIVLSRAHDAYVEAHPEFIPARARNRRLLGLEE